MWKYRSADAVPEVEFYDARRGESRRSVPVETWYAVKAAPGAQRCPSMRDGHDRKGESIVERNLRNEGFEAFMPSYRIEVRHHRQGHWIERRFPIFVGYLFVNIGPHDYRAVESVDGVSKILRYSKRFAEKPMPFEFAQETIDRLRYIEWEQEQNFLVARARRQREEELSREQPGRRGKSPNRRIRRAQFTELGGGLSSSLQTPSSRVFITETMKALGNLAGGIE
ncbi:transcription termination/antitermination NusG family protein [Rhizobium phaseoli]|uniref:transcription termination/antitermination NusG family protein n=1 Tax=Rhizobium phaseoli TaxID=396 RepID=UPI0007EBFB84|nr:transcription termination/antitermination NusG family protein [Rhizobium phaseoli]ANL34096.1 transcription antitermination NusG domain-containing protein [Rhizobium phaseoli]ANL97819.1 transcription antitermination NusG domain-containing protein [Rhizobium phaseoli]